MTTDREICECEHSTIIHDFSRPDGESFARPTRCLHPGCTCKDFRSKVNLDGNAIRDVLAEVERAEAKHPEWPGDPFVGIAIITEEVGEAAQAIIDAQYHNGDPEHIRDEIVQVACTAIRFLKNWDARKPK